MFDAASPSRSDPDGKPDAPAALAALPRARGTIDIAVKDDAGRTRLARLRHQGSAKCLLPRTLPADPVEAVIVNTAGGVTGGDRFAWAAEAGPDTRLTLTTQAAERVYKARGETTAEVTTRLTIGPRATLAWAPHPTILFDGGRLERRIEADMAPDARLLVLEGLILGREAMGETVRQGHLADRWAIRRDGRLVFADALRLSGPIAEIAARPAVMNGARAALSLVYVAPDAGDRLDRLRAVLPPSTARETAGASAWDGMLAARAVVPDGQALVALMHRIVTALGPLAPPRGWAF